MSKIDYDISEQIAIKYNEAETLQMEALFNIWRFGIRRLKISDNCLHEHTHCFLVSGDNSIHERILICLVEDRKGSIKTIKTYRNPKMDYEMASYVIKAALEVLNENYGLANG